MHHYTLLHTGIILSCSSSIYYKLRLCKTKLPRHIVPRSFSGHILLYFCHILVSLTTVLQVPGFVEEGPSLMG